MAIVTVLRPKIACNRVLRVSEIWVDHLTVLLQLLSTDQPTEMLYEMTYWSARHSHQTQMKRKWHPMLASFTEPWPHPHCLPFPFLEFFSKHINTTKTRAPFMLSVCISLQSSSVYGWHTLMTFYSCALMSIQVHCRVIRLMFFSVESAHSKLYVLLKFIRFMLYSVACCELIRLLKSHCVARLRSRAEFKVLLLTYKVLNGQALSYLKGLIVPFCPSRTLNADLLDLPKVSKSGLRARAFSC